MTVPAGVIAVWRGTLATIPAGWDLCDGGDSRPNLLGKFLRGAADGIDPGGEGGSDAHAHTENGTGGAHNHTGTSGSDGAHQHTTPNSTGNHTHGTDDAFYNNIRWYASDASAGNHNHTWPNEGAHTHTIDSQGAHSHTFQNADTRPAYYEVAFIISDGTPINFAENIIVLWSGTLAAIPTGFSVESNLVAKFLRGVPDAITDPGTTGGSDSHLHVQNTSGAHTHTLAATSDHTHTADSAGSHNHGKISTTKEAIDAGGSTNWLTPNNPVNGGAHTHSCGSDGGHSHTAADPGAHAHIINSSDGRPPFYELAPIKAGVGGVLRKTGIITIWTGTIAAIPADWALCDGGGSRPDLREKFVRGINAVDADPGTTGGNATHTHTVQAAGGHTHTIDEQGAHTHTAVSGSWSHRHGSAEFTDVNLIFPQNYAYGGSSHNHGNLSSTGGHSSHSITADPNHSDHTYNTFSSLPTYYDVAFIYATSDELLTGSQDLFAKATIRQTASQDLFAKLEVRQTASQNLFAKFHIQRSEDLYCHFWVAIDSFLPTRKHRKGIMIKGAPSPQTDYPIPLTVHYGAGTDSGRDVYLDNKCCTDFGDIVFTAKDGTTLLDFWIQSKTDSDNAVIWIEVANIPADGDPIYIYYGGYTKARTSSDIEATFSFGDDFDDNEIDPAKWTCATHGSGGSYVEQTEEMALHASDNQTGSATARTVPTFTNDIVIEFRARASSPNYYGLTLGKGNIVGDTCGGTDWWHTFLDEGYIVCVQTDTDFQYRYAHCPGAIDLSETDIDGPDAGTYYYFRVIYKSNGDFEWYWSADGITYALLGSGYNETTYLATAKTIMFYRGGWAGGARGGWLGISHVFVRKYTNAEPTAGRWSTEQDNPNPFENLWAKFDVGQDSVDLFAKFSVRHVGTPQNLFGKLEVRQASSQNLFAKFHVGQDSEDLFAKLDVRHAASQNLFAKFEMQAVQNLFGKFIIQHSASQELYAKFEAQATRNLFGKFEVRQAASQDLFAKLNVRQAASQSLFAKFVVRFSSSQNLFGKAKVRHAASQNLFGKFVIRKAASQDLLAKFVVRQQSSQNLFTKFVVRQPSSQNLFAKFVIQKAASQNLFGKFVVRHAASQNLFAKFIVNASVDLFAKFIIRHAASQNLFSKFIVRHIGYVTGLYCEFIVRHASSQNLYVKFEVQASQDLYAKFTVRHATSQNLFSKFEVRQTGIQNLFSKFIVRQPASQNLFGKFEIRKASSQNLFSKFVIRKADSQNLLGKFTIRTAASQNLFAKAIIRLAASQNLFVKFNVTKSGSSDLYSKFIVRHAASADLFNKFIVRHLGTQNLFAKFIIRHAASQDLLGKFIVRHLGTRDLFGKFVVRHAASRDLFAKFDAQAVQNLFVKFIVRHADARNLFGKFVVRHASSQDLYAKFDMQGVQLLYAKFIVRHAAAQNLFSKFVVRHAAAQDLYAKFEAQGVELLFCKFIVRHADSQDLFAKFIVRHAASQALFCKFNARHTAYERLFLTFWIRPTESTAAEMIIGGQERRLVLGGTERELIIGGRKRRMTVK